MTLQNGHSFRIRDLHQLDTKAGISIHDVAQVVDEEYEIDVLDWLNENREEVGEEKLEAIEQADGVEFDYLLEAIEPHGPYKTEPEVIRKALEASDDEWIVIEDNASGIHLVDCKS